mmetsp:Transcript_8194/g.24404  ORF Transcript_8194/g.24404 Transcript_8194/m.24404 type:complete len:306 (+) Transcript_8194:2007-2924(+)
MRHRSPPSMNSQTIMVLSPDTQAPQNMTTFAARQLRKMATSRQNWACPAGSCWPPTILTATVCTPPSSALYTWPKAPAPISHWRPSGRVQISMSSGRSSQSEKGTRGSCTPSTPTADPLAPSMRPLDARLSLSLLAPALRNRLSISMSMPVSAMLMGGNTRPRPVAGAAVPPLPPPLLLVALPLSVCARVFLLPMASIFCHRPWGGWVLAATVAWRCLARRHSQMNTTRKATTMATTVPLTMPMMSSTLLALLPPPSPGMVRPRRGGPPAASPEPPLGAAASSPPMKRSWVSVAFTLRAMRASFS